MFGFALESPDCTLLLDGLVNFVLAFERRLQQIQVVLFDADILVYHLLLIFAQSHVFRA